MICLALDLVVALLVRTLNQIGQSGKLITGTSPEEIENAIARLVKFAAGGMKA